MRNVDNDAEVLIFYVLSLSLSLCLSGCRDFKKSQKNQISKATK